MLKKLYWKKPQTAPLFGCGTSWVDIFLDHPTSTHPHPRTPTFLLTQSVGLNCLFKIWSSYFLYDLSFDILSEIFFWPSCLSKFKMPFSDSWWNDCCYCQFNDNKHGRPLNCEPELWTILLCFTWSKYRQCFCLQYLFYSKNIIL